MRRHQTAEPSSFLPGELLVPSLPEQARIKTLGRLSLKEVMHRSLALVALIGTLSTPALFTNRANANGPSASNTPVSSQGLSEKFFGVVDDEAKQPKQSEADKRMRLMSDAGIQAVIESVWWVPGYQHLTDLPKKDRDNLDNSLNAAENENINVMLLIEQVGWVNDYSPPLRPSQQRGFCDVAADLAQKYPWVEGYIIGNEINNPTFWSPQFTPDGTDAVATPYVSLLSTCYDKLKAINPNILVIGGSLAAKGNDNPHPSSGSASHSPTAEIINICNAYKKSGRNLPLMDVLSIHPYPENPEDNPLTQHPNSTTITIADYEKLRKIEQCFNGTPQSIPPVLWGEFGLNAQDIEQKGNARSAQAAKFISEEQQGQYYGDMVRMAYCQPESIGFFSFLAFDDPGNGWKSGIYNRDLTPKKSLLAFKAAMNQVNSISPNVEC